VSGTYAFSTSVAVFDTVLTVRDSTCETELGCSNDVVGMGAERIVLDLEIGEEVIIDVDGSGGFGPFALGIEQLGCPRTQLDGTLPIQVAGNTEDDDALNFISDACAGQEGAERTYWFTAPAKGLYTVSVLGSSQGDAALVLREGKNCDGGHRGCRLSSFLLGARAGQLVALEEGESITIAVESVTGGAIDFDLRVELTQTCASVTMSDWGQQYVLDIPGSVYGMASCVTAAGPAATIGVLPVAGTSFVSLSVQSDVDAGIAYFRGSDPCFGEEVLCIPYGDPPSTPDLGLMATGEDLTISVESLSGPVQPGAATFEYFIAVP
jgi:hypothetical protein